MNSKYLYRGIRFCFVVGFILLLFFSFYYLSSLTYPFLIAWFIALLMNPFVNFLQIKGKLPRPLSVLIGLVIIFGIIASLLTLLVTEIIAITEFLAKSSPDFINNVVHSIENWITNTIIPLFNSLSTMFFNLGALEQETIITNIQELGSTLATSTASILQAIISKLPAFISWFPNAAMVLIFTVLATFFISNDWYRLRAIGSKFLPSKVKENSMSVYIDLRKALFGFVRAQLTLISITFVIVLIGLLVLKVNYAFVLAVVIGLVDLLPYLGTGFVFVPWIAYNFIVENYSLGIGLVVLYVVVLVQRQLMEPKIVSTNIGLSPLATLVAIFVGLKLLGFVGLIVGPILLVIVLTLHRTGVLSEIWNFIKGDEVI